MSGITWTNERRKLSQLIPWPKNPRQIKGDQVRRLQESLTEFGQVEPVCIGPDNDLYNGHQRLKSWQAKFGDIEIEVRVSSRALTEKEREKLTVFLHKGAAGEWDMDALANGFEIPDLIEWGFRPYELGVVDEAVNPSDEWKDMPEFDNEPKAAKSINIHFRTMADYEAFGELIKQDLTDKTNSIWFPKAERRNMLEIEYKNES